MIATIALTMSHHVDGCEMQLADAQGAGETRERFDNAESSSFSIPTVWPQDNQFGCKRRSLLLYATTSRTHICSFQEN